MKKNFCQVFHQFTKKNLPEQGVQDDLNKNKTKFEWYGDLVDDSYSKFNETLINNEISYSQT